MQEQNKRQIIQLYFNVGFDCFYSAGFFKYRYVYVFLLTNPCIPCDTKENREGDTLNECMDCL